MAYDTALSSGKAQRRHNRPLPGPALPESPPCCAQPASSLVSEELEGVQGAGPPESPSSASLSADLGDLFNFWKLLFSFLFFIN